jgi:XRE family transcriptional regulator of biofilm formation
MSNRQEHEQSYWFKNIRILREERGFTIEELSRATGVSVSYLSRLETGLRKVPSVFIVYKIAKVLGVTVEKLLDANDVIEL